MTNVSEPSPAMILAILDRGERMGQPITWRQAREVAVEFFGNTANDNPWPFMREPAFVPRRRKMLWVKCGKAGISILSGAMYS